MKLSGNALRVLLGAAAGLVLFGLVAALLLDTDDDDEAAEDTTTTTEDTTTTTEADSDSTTTSSSTTSTTEASTSSSSSTSTTRATTTTRPGAPTTATTSPPTTVAETTTVPHDPEADLVLSRTPLSPPVFRFSIGNAGPDPASAVELVVTVGPDMTITSAAGRQGMTCGAVEGATVRCTVDQAPVGGRVAGAQLEVSGSGEVRASVRSATPDPDLRDNTVLSVAT